MNLERRLRDHFDAAGSSLAEPEPRLANVVRRGRRRRAVQSTALTAGTAAVAAFALLGIQQLPRNDVEFPPAAPPSSSPTTRADATPDPVPTQTPQPVPTVTATETTAAPVETVTLADLGGPVLAYGGAASGVRVHDGDESRLVWSGPVDVALADGTGGIVVQSRNTLRWFPSVDAAGEGTTIVESDEPLELRAILRDGRVLYSIVDRKRSEDMVERFYAVELADGATAELLATDAAFESWRIGPAATADGLVMAQCHMLCSVYAWPSSPGSEALYHGGAGRQGAIAAIDGLTATRDGTVIGFVEGHTVEDAGAPELVLLDGASFQRLAVVPLPAGNIPLGPAAVSFSGDRQAVLVSLDVSQRRGGVYRSFLVEDTRSATPAIREIDFDGMIRWLELGGNR